MGPSIGHSGDSEEKNKLYLVNWDTLNLPTAQGRLGIMDLIDINEALGTKWIYSYTNYKDALWRKVVCTQTVIRIVSCQH